MIFDSIPSSLPDGSVEVGDLALSLPTADSTNTYRRRCYDGAWDTVDSLN